jgi:acyl-CoA synthetase (NDP forming)
MSPSFFKDPDVYRLKLEAESLFLENNIPIFSHLTYMGMAISNIVKYNNWLKKQED